MKNRDVLIGGAILLLLAVALVRIAVPDRSRIRPISIEGFDIKSERVDPGQVLTRELPWSPPDDVYVMGWNPYLGTPSDVKYDADMMLYDPDRKVTVFVTGYRVTPPTSTDAWRFYSLPLGTGFLLRKGERLLLRYRITNTGAQSFETNGATALVYFVPVTGN
jgi:hypothetical protein